MGLFTKLCHWCGNRERLPETRRYVTMNDQAANKMNNYCSNSIKTSRYEYWNFLPLNLFEQFHRVANFYFLVLSGLQLIPSISPLNPATTILPLVIVLAISAFKDGIDDYRRRSSDKRLNNRKLDLLRYQNYAKGVTVTVSDKAELISKPWMEVEVGDIILIRKNDAVAADVVLLTCSDLSLLCFIETAELDGETNLKVRSCLSETSDCGADLARLRALQHKVECEAPNNNLNRFEGVLKLSAPVRNATTGAMLNEVTITNDNVLLRGCVLRNTDWCYGLVVFAGPDTKLMKNSGPRKFKRTHIDRLLNVLIIVILIALITLSSLLAIGTTVMIEVRLQHWVYWAEFAKVDKFFEGFKTFFSFVIILNTLVPISLYVSVEFIRFFNSIWIQQDLKMYCTDTDEAARTNTTTLNEELGQIEYIFSDKTGTLTRNVMRFVDCSIGGRCYGNSVATALAQAESERSAAPIQPDEVKLTKRFGALTEPSFLWYDERLATAVETRDGQVHNFFRILAVCHTVMADISEEECDEKGKPLLPYQRLTYQAQSPDEAALVSAARNFGFVFKSRDRDSITIEVLGVVESYNILAIFDFDNVRKRMSILVKRDERTPAELWTKGADTVVYERLHHGQHALRQLTDKHLEDYSTLGLRTLVVAKRVIPDDVLSSWFTQFRTAATALQDRDELLSRAYNALEKDMELVGVTAVEDRLQDGVADTISLLRSAGIKIWVLTGDKIETAINIGYSCQMLTTSMSEIVISTEESEQVKLELERALLQLSPAPPPPAKENGGASMHPGTGSTPRSPTPPQVPMANDGGGFALIMSGPALAQALQGNEMKRLFLSVASCCQAVICCRVTPLQKAQVVDLVKTNLDTRTLAIGDGMNDVSMLQAAHIGVGISGHEGQQAAMAADYAFSQFRYLSRLLLVHGRWSYLRMTTFLTYFFYKNLTATLPQAFFAMVSGFSATTVVSSLFVGLFNLCYTSWPVLALAFHNKDISDELSLRLPKLYYAGLHDLYWSAKRFAYVVIEGAWAGATAFLVPMFVFNFDFTNSASYNFYIASVETCIMLTVTGRICFDTITWTGWNFFVIIGSTIFFFLINGICAAPLVADWILRTGFSDILRVADALAVWQTSRFWLAAALQLVLALMPIITIRLHAIITRPTLAHRASLMESYRNKGSYRSLMPYLMNIRKLPSRFVPTSLTRDDAEPTFGLETQNRQSSRRKGSSYAFSQGPGFGNMIMSGKLRQSNRMVDWRWLSPRGKHQATPSSPETDASSSNVAGPSQRAATPVQKSLSDTDVRQEERRRSKKAPSSNDVVMVGDPTRLSPALLSGSRRGRPTTLRAPREDDEVTVSVVDIGVDRSSPVDEETRV